MAGTRSEFGANRDRDLVLLRLSGSNGGGGGSVTLLSGAEHEGLVDVAEVSGLSLGLLEPRLQLRLGHLEVTNVGGRCGRQGPSVYANTMRAIRAD